MVWRTFLDEKIDFVLNRRTLESFISWCTKLKVDHRVVRKWEITTLVYSFANNKVKEIFFLLDTTLENYARFRNDYDNRKGKYCESLISKFNRSVLTLFLFPAM